MKTLGEILSEHIEGGYGAWMKLYDDIIKYRNEFAIEVAKEALKNAAEKLEYEYCDYDEQVDYSFITEETNIPKL